MTVGPCGLSPGEAAAWDAFVRGCPRASHSQLSGWGRVTERSYGHRGRYLWAREGETVRGVLPLVLMRSLGAGRALVSMPFLDDGGICAVDDRSTRALLEAAVGLLRAERARVLDLRHRDPSGLDLGSHGTKVTLTLALAPEPDRMWTRFDAKLRNQIRKATRSGLTASWHGVEGLDEFYGVFAVNMRDLGSPVHARGFFRALLEEFADSARIVLVHREREAIAAGVCLAFRDTLLMPWASARREHFALCPNNLLYWEVLRWGCEKGYGRFDFGRSSPGSGTYRFKRQWGAVEQPLHWQQLGAGPRRGTTLDPGSPGLSRAVRAWQRLPVPVATLLGPLLRKRISN